MATAHRRGFLTATAATIGTGAVASTGSRGDVGPRSSVRSPTRSRWDRTLGGASMGAFACVRTLADGYLLAGTARDDGYATEGWTVELGPDGDVTRRQRYLSADHRAYLDRDPAAGPEPQDGFSFVLPAPADDGHLLVGWSYFDGPAIFVGWLVRVDADGTVVWERYLPDLVPDSSYSYLADGIRTDGGYLLCGIESPGIMLGGAGWLVSVADDGTPNWYRRYPATERDLETTGRRDTFRSIVETDDGYLLAGDYEPEDGSGRSQAWLVAVGDRGDVRWEADFAVRPGKTNRIYALEPREYGTLVAGAAGEMRTGATPFGDGAFLYDHGMDGDGFVTAYTGAGERRWFRTVDETPLYCTHVGSKGAVVAGDRNGRGWIGAVERTDLQADRPSTVTCLADAHDGEFVAAGRTTNDDVRGWATLFDGYDTESDGTDGGNDTDNGGDGSDEHDADSGDGGDEGDGENEGDGNADGGDGEGAIEFVDCETVRVAGEFADVILGVVFWDEDGLVGTIKEPVGGVDGDRTVRATDAFGTFPAGPVVEYAEAFEPGTPVVPGNGDVSATHPDYESCKSAALESVEGGGDDQSAAANTTSGRGADGQDGGTEADGRDGGTDRQNGGTDGEATGTDGEGTGDGSEAASPSSWIDSWSARDRIVGGIAVVGGLGSAIGYAASQSTTEDDEE